MCLNVKLSPPEISFQLQIDHHMDDLEIGGLEHVGVTHSSIMQFWPRKQLTLCPDQKCPFLLLKRKHPCCPCSVLKPFLFLGEIPWFTNGFTRKTSPPARASGGTCRWCSAWNRRWKSLQDSSFKPRFWREKISSMLENKILQSWRITSFNLGEKRRNSSCFSVKHRCDPTT